MFESCRAHQEKAPEIRGFRPSGVRRTSPHDAYSTPKPSSGAVLAARN